MDRACQEIFCAMNPAVLDSVGMPARKALEKFWNTKYNIDYYG